MSESDSNFPIEVNSRLVNGLQKIMLFNIKILALLMTIVVLWSTIEVVILLYQKALQPPYLLLNFEDILSTFGAFLVVLIAIEIFVNIILYLRKDISHLKLVVATALMAIARKIIILDYDHTPSTHLYGIATIIFALGIAYWFIHKKEPKKAI